MIVTQQILQSLYLHSTMYLLNPNQLIADKYALYKFTFHYVSIKSSIHHTADLRDMNLHSTMYLLNPVSKELTRYSLNLFTFHYVSIKSSMWRTKLNHF